MWNDGETDEGQGCLWLGKETEIRGRSKWKRNVKLQRCILNDSLLRMYAVCFFFRPTQIVKWRKNMKWKNFYQLFRFIDDWHFLWGKTDGPLNFWRIINMIWFKNLILLDKNRKVFDKLNDYCIKIRIFLILKNIFVKWG